MTDIRVERTEGIVRITFARPQKKNAFTGAMYDAVAKAIGDASKDNSTRAIVFAGDGDAFSAGNDLKDFVRDPPKDMDNPPFRMLRALLATDAPVIAAVQGAAVGIGTTMLLHCDFVFADETARFQLPFVDLGLVPEGASTLLLPRLCGWPKANELLLLSKRINSEQAVELGMINEAVSSGALESRVQQCLDELGLRPIDALRATKRLLREPMRADINASLEREGKVFFERLQSPEAKAAFARFLGPKSA